MEELDKNMEYKNTQINKLESEIKINKIKEYTKIFLMISSFLLIIIGYSYVALQNGIISTKLNVPDKSIAVVNFNEPVTLKYVNKVISQLEMIKDNKEVKEILFIMNCPGGSPAASDELSVYLKNYTKVKKVNMYIQEMAASGGYYIASSISPILSNQNAIVGSIGVIMNKYSLEDLSKIIGVKEDFVTAGKYKVPASLLKTTTKEDRKYLSNNLLQPVYNNFLNVVKTNRNISDNDISNYAEGRIFIANTKEGLILVDEITNLYSIKEKLKKQYNDSDLEPLNFFELITKDKDFNLLGVEFKIPELNQETSNILY